MQLISLVFERKLGIFSKIKSKIPDFERGKAKIIILEIPQCMDACPAVFKRRG